MEGIIRHGRNVEEAVQSALEELNARRDEVQVEVLDAGARGVLGIIGQREATVRVTLDVDKVRAAQDFAETVVGHINPDLKVQVTDNDQYITCEIQGDDLGLVIGRHGETLNSIQYLINVAAAKGSVDRRPIIVDAGNYRRRRKRDLINLAHRLGHRAVKTGNAVRMSALPPHERKIVHTALHDNPRITTESEGRDPQRCVVITPTSKSRE